MSQQQPAPSAWQNRIVAEGDEAPDQLLANPANWRVHPKAQQDALGSVLESVGWVQRVLVNRLSGHVVDGHLRVALALSRDEPTVPVSYVKLSPADEAIVLASLDPIAAMAGTDKDKLAELLADAQINDDALRAAIADVANLPTAPKPGKTDPDAMPEPRETTIEAGDLFALGDHRLLCGSCTDEVSTKRVMGDQAVDMLITDPPYCSGGVQEAGKHAGSVGRRGEHLIANDTLSTRGYTALMRQAINLANVGVVYVFTDWHMWVSLFDIVESSGFGVRSMIVWDKASPGMGRGWRSQHELILSGSKVAQPFNPTSSSGNVIQCGRTGNTHHATEKPVELLARIMSVSDHASTIYEPFCGSGTTLIAAEQLGRRCYALEIEPSYCQVTIDRWEAFTGQSATKVT